MDATELCLVPDVLIPAKFKVPEFEKYDGTKCPMAHITMYCRKMAAQSHDDKSLNNEHEDNLDNDLNIDFEIIPNIDELKNEEEVDSRGSPGTELEFTWISSDSKLVRDGFSPKRRDKSEL
ncbi:Uncharacterized protein TCM_012144 [Theobroma cacao]|uniref:Uncharacterized protein n=1 Tax=Theobroma cacao TaxID=3641 RepID=A0A061FUA5_THECC|nr:Uncharacterized protein TCM_012144 [Theobroma cacao]